MNGLKVYLSSATLNVDDKFQDWRTTCIKYWNDSGLFYDLDFINPISYFNYTDKQPKTDKQCIDLFMWMIDKSDVLLVNLDHSEKSIGTAMEVEHAYCNNIPIVGFGKKSDTWYNWVVERASVVFDNLEEAVCYINNTYSDITR